jgi:hypothetical protein
VNSSGSDQRVFLFYALLSLGAAIVIAVASPLYRRKSALET